MKNIEDILLYKEEQSLDEGIIANTGKMIVNGIKQLGANAADGINKIQTASNDKVNASNEATAQAQAQAQSSNIEKLLSAKSGIDLKSANPSTKPVVDTINTIVGLIDNKMASLQKEPDKNAAQQTEQPAPITDKNGTATTDVANDNTDQVKESMNLEDILALRLYEGDDTMKQLNNLKKFKDGLTKTMSSGVLSSKGIKSIIDNAKKIIGESPDLTKSLDTLNKSYSTAVETQFKQYQDKLKQPKDAATKTEAAPANTTPSQAATTPAEQKPVDTTAKPDVPTEQKPADTTAKTDTTAAQKPADQEQVKQDSIKAQDVIKKCSSALSQISSSIDAIKTKSPNADFGAPSKEGLYASIEGNTYIDQVKNIVTKVSADLGNYVLIQESKASLDAFKKIQEELNDAYGSLDLLKQLF